jgi:hypothetical protein
MPEGGHFPRPSNPNISPVMSASSSVRSLHRAAQKGKGNICPTFPCDHWLERFFKGQEMARELKFRDFAQLVHRFSQVQTENSIDVV